MGNKLGCSLQVPCPLGDETTTGKDREELSWPRALDDDE
jgi:hypothetical protein